MTRANLAKESIDLMTVAEVSRLLRVGNSTVRKWITTGRIPYVELPGGDYRIPRVELVRALRGNVDVSAVLTRIEAGLAVLTDREITEEIHAVRAKRRTARG